MQNQGQNLTFQRIGVAILAATLFVIAGLTFYTMASIPTDENLFTGAPSPALITRTIPAHQEGPGRSRAGLRKDPTLMVVTDSLLRGDLLVALGDDPVRSFKNLPMLFSGFTTDTLQVRIYRPDRDAFYTYSVGRDILDPTLYREMASAVVVVDVSAGGASDRAGMRVGDFIVRINGKSFGNAQEADAILRRGESGVATVYDIVRDGKPLSLSVTLARFGFPLALLVFWLTGLCYLAFGSFLLYQRPGLAQARSLGLSFLLMGFVIAVVAITREPDPTWFTRTRDVLITLAAFLGTGFGFHAQGIFPVERRRSVYRRWGLPLMYAASVLSPLLLLSDAVGIRWVALMGFVIAGFIANILGLTKLPPQFKKIVRPIRLVTVLVMVLAVIMIVGLAVMGGGNAFGFVGMLLLFIPLSYVYILGRYRLLGLDFRVRRNVQYTLLSWGWGILMAVLFIRLLLWIPGLPVQVPGITLSGLSVEIDPLPTSPEQQVFMERLVVIFLAAGTWYLLWRVRKAGQQFIDRKYYRTQFDYRRAASSLSAMLSTRLSMDETARGIVDTLVDVLSLKSAGLLVFRNGEECCCEAAAGLTGEQWKDIVCVADRMFASEMISHSDPVRVELLSADIRTLLSAHQFQCVVPIRSKEQLRGALLVGEKLSETPLGAEDLSFLAGVAKQLSVSIENAFLYEELAGKERMRHELNIARRIQLSSLPSVTPRIPGLDISGMSSPALEVGGDFFDYLNGDAKGLMVIVGDVSGKGTSAALYMSKVQGILRSLHGFGLPPRELFIRANRLLCQDLERSSFVTALGGHYVPGTHELTLVRAGHVPLFHYHAQSAIVERVLPRGLGLGLDNVGVFAREIEERVVGFANGDVMVFITDGVLEARNAAGEEFGEERVEALLCEAAGLDAVGIRDTVVREIQSFGKGMDQHDDQTVVVVKAL